MLIHRAMVNQSLIESCFLRERTHPITRKSTLVRSMASAVASHGLTILKMYLFHHRCHSVKTSDNPKRRDSKKHIADNI